MARGKSPLRPVSATPSGHGHLGRLDAPALDAWHEQLRGLADPASLHVHLRPGGQPGLVVDSRPSPVVALDLDSTLFPIIDAIAALPGNADLTMAEVATWDHLVGRFGGVEPMLAQMDAAMDQDHCLGVAPFAGAGRVLSELVAAHNARLVVMTDRPLGRVLDTIAYLDHHDLPYGALLCGRMPDKISVCRAIGAATIVDDRPSTIEAAHAAGLLALTLDHPYTREVTGRLGVGCAEGWAELAPALSAALSR